MELGPIEIDEAPPPVAVAVAVRAARAKLNAPRRPGSVWPLLGAAAFFAASALSLAVAVIVGPPRL